MKRYSFKLNGKELVPVKELVNNSSKYGLPGEHWVAHGDFGKASFQIFSTEDYDIWYNHYEVAKDFELCVSLDSPLMMFRAQLNHDVNCFFGGMELGCREGQYEIIHVPQVEAVVKFRQGRKYDSFIILFRHPFFQSYVASSIQLANFLDRVAKNRIARLFDRTGFLSPAMEDGIRAILTHKGDLAHRFIECRVHELIILLIHQLNLSGRLSEPDAIEIEKAEKVKKIISDDLSRLFNVETLARRVHTTEPKLQATFKHLYGTTVGKFSRELHLKKAHELLSDPSGTRETLLSIALSVGYNDVSNFANAFKLYFGYTPGAIYKRANKQQH